MRKTDMFDGHDHTLCELLARRAAMAPEELQRHYAEHERTGRPLAELLFAAGLIDRPGLLRLVAEDAGARLLLEPPAQLDADTLGVLDPELARRHGVVPLASGPDSLTVMPLAPFDRQLAADLGFAVGRPVEAVVADPAYVRVLFQRHYGPVDTSAGQKVTDRGTTGSPHAVTAEDPVIAFVDHTLERAVREKASDIHFEPFEDDFKVRCRIDGTLQAMQSPPAELVGPIISRLKVLAGLDIAERRVPQDGRLRVDCDGRAVDLRVSTLPTQFGESVVLRVLDRAAMRLDLERLGLPGGMEQRLRGLLRRSGGIFIVTGPTGSGKTTTLYSCLKELNSPRVKALTVEDPVEYEFAGVMQVPVNHAAELDFARTLRSFLRQDPDIIMVGEIRDDETARIAIQAALTGHLVLTTLHTTDAPGAVTRLMDMGIEPFLLASTIEAVLAQRLVRRICGDCRVRCTPAPVVLEHAGLSPEDADQRVFHRGTGCASCQFTGYRGRLGLFELMEVDESLRELIAAGVPLEELRQAAARCGLTPLRAAGLHAVEEGATTLEEILTHT